jgi:hypothetical protein
VILNHDGVVRIERVFIRPEDDKPQAETEPGNEGQAPDGRTERTITRRRMAKKMRAPSGKRTRTKRYRVFATSPRTALWGCASI